MKPVDHEATRQAVAASRITQLMGARLKRLEGIPEDLRDMPSDLAVAYVMATVRLSHDGALDYLAVTRGETDVIQRDEDGMETFG